MTAADATAGAGCAARAARPWNHGEVTWLEEGATGPYRALPAHPRLQQSGALPQWAPRIASAFVTVALLSLVWPQVTGLFFVAGNLLALPLIVGVAVYVRVVVHKRKARHPHETWRWSRALRRRLQWAHAVRGAERWLLLGAPAAAWCLGSAPRWMRQDLSPPEVVLGFAAAGVAIFAALRAYLLWSRGRTGVQFPEVPLRLGPAARLDFVVHEDAADVETPVFTLRRIEERTNVAGHGSRYLCVATHEGTVAPRDHEWTPTAGTTTELSFDLPERVAPVDPLGLPPSYWQLEVSGETRGRPYREFFLVPVSPRVPPPRKAGAA